MRISSEDRVHCASPHPPLKIRFGISLWQGTESAAAKNAALESDFDSEVAVVGAGITGTLVAYYLSLKGVNTILLDKHRCAGASTAASTGLLQYETDTHLCDLIVKVGEAAVVRSYHLGLEAINELQELAGEVSPTCGFSRKPSLYLAHTAGSSLPPAMLPTKR